MATRGNRAPQLRALALSSMVLLAGACQDAPSSPPAASDLRPGTIRHLVVIFQENVSFDHYFATYPNAANTDGTAFTARPGTPAVDGLPATGKGVPANLAHSRDLIKSNPNTAPPRRLDSTPTGKPGGAGGQLTCDEDHNYADEQQAENGGKMDQFVESVGVGKGKAPDGTPCQPATVMDYYDGNTVTAFWNYAQQYAISDNSFTTTFGPSSPGAVNLISGNTGTVDMSHTAKNPAIGTPESPNGAIVPDGIGGYSLIGDAQPYYDDCSTRDAVAMKGQNVGDLLNAAQLSWGWFEGGFRPTVSYADALAATGHAGQATAAFVPDEFAAAGFESRTPHATNQGLCDAVHPVGLALDGASGRYGYKNDYIPHHEPFQYYATTANPHHLTIDAARTSGPGSLAAIGTDTQTFAGGYGREPQFDTPNHQYDMSDFDALVGAITAGRLPESALPAVSFLKAPAFQDGHAAYSDPADEQAFVVKELNLLQASPAWPSTAVIITYDDSDGWYDHVYAGVQNPSFSASDNLTNAVLGSIAAGHPVSQECGSRGQGQASLNGQQGRCGLATRIPTVVISPCARANHVDHNLSNLASIPNFIEFNWKLPSIAGSFDQLLAKTDREAGIAFDLGGMFDGGCRNAKLHLDPATGAAVP